MIALNMVSVAEAAVLGVTLRSDDGDNVERGGICTLQLGQSMCAEVAYEPCGVNSTPASFIARDLLRCDAYILVPPRSAWTRSRRSRFASFLITTLTWYVLLLSLTHRIKKLMLAQARSDLALRSADCTHPHPSQARRDDRIKPVPLARFLLDTSALFASAPSAHSTFTALS